MTLSSRAMGWALLALLLATPTLAKGQPGAITVFVLRRSSRWTRPNDRDGSGGQGWPDPERGVPCRTRALLKSNKHTVDEQFKDKVLMPASLTRIFTRCWARSRSRRLDHARALECDGEKTPATLGQEAYRKALKTAFDARRKDAPIFMTWGYSADSHGDLSGEVLDGISKDVPILVCSAPCTSLTSTRRCSFF